MNALNKVESRKPRRNRFVLAAIWLLTASPSFALSDAALANVPATPPRIGLVLEGGSALGLAHIGVIKWLEEHRIPVQYVAGTSMGGLVGGLYATGSSPAEMEELAGTLNWDELIGGQIPFQVKAYRRKEDAIAYPNDLEFGLKHGIQFPEGFNSGHAVGLLLDRIAFPYSFVPNFDKLPIPFACTATDLVSGKLHVFRDGSLAVALRSTMAIPAVFSPVRTESSIFVDGGLLDNLPVDVAKQMGADVIVAVHLEREGVRPDARMSPVRVLGRSVSVVINANVLRSMQSADILISVPVGRFQTSDYSRSAEIIKLGYEAAASKAAVLSRFSLDDEQWKQYLAARNSRRKPVFVPQFVEVTGTAPRIAKAIESHLQPEIGEPVNPNDLDKELTSVMGMGRFDRVGYTGTERDQRKGLMILADEKPYAPPTVLPILDIDGTEYRRVQLTVGARITFLDLGGFGSELRNDVSVGSNSEIRSSYYRPYANQLHWFYEPSGYAANTLQDFYHGSTLISEYRNRQYGGAFDIGYQFGNIAEFRTGYRGGYQKFDPSIGRAEFGTLDGRVGVGSLRYDRLGRDDAVVPHQGTDLHFRTEWQDANPGATEGFPLAQAITRFFVPLSAPSSLFYEADGGTTFTFNHVGFPPFTLGGVPNLLAYGSNEILTNQYMLFKAGYIRNLGSLPFGSRIYAAGLGEFARTEFPNSPAHYPTDAAGLLIIKTIIGPIMIGGAYGASGHQKFFYQVGRIF
jgi:NTE family protein